MRKLLFVAFPLLTVVGATAMAQDKPTAMASSKIDTKWHCLKPAEQHQLDIGDMPGHAYGITQGTCDATPGGNLAEKTGQYTESQELRKASMSSRGIFISTLDNGDKLRYMYTFSGPTGSTKPMSNRWKIVNGTGKHKGIKGSGTCSAGKTNADGSIDWACTGTYSMGK